MKKSLTASMLISVLYFLIMAIFVIGNPAGVSHMAIFIFRTLWAVVLTMTLFLILKTGKISKYRSLFFTIFAFSFILMFVTNLLEERGSMALTAEIIANNETPLCPIAIPMLILPAVFKNTLIFPTKLIGGPYGGFFPILFMWLVSLFTLGRGWCSWGCFYGGIDEGFSNIRRKPIIPNKFLSKWLRLVPFIVLTLIVVWSFLAMSPVYCEWLCPLKLVTEYPEINSFRSYLQAIIFISLGVSLLFILPVLTKKRTQCAFFCPLGAFQSLLGKVNPFTIKIDQNKCINCQKCIALCPVMAITENSLARGKVLMTCSKCGKCIEHCPVGAIDFNLPGKAILPQTNNRFFLLVKEILAPGTLFIFTAMVFGGIISGGTVPGALFRIFNLFANGSLLLH